MTDETHLDDIEAVVGVPRDPVRHYVRVVSQTQDVYLLHSEQCRLTHGPGAVTCAFTLAMEDRGVGEEFPQDVAVPVGVLGGRVMRRET